MPKPGLKLWLVNTDAYVLVPFWRSLGGFE